MVEENLKEKLIYDYNVPISMCFDLEMSLDCPICDHRDKLSDLAPFFYSNAPAGLIRNIIKDEYHIDVTEADIEKHRNHIKPTVDRSITDKARADFVLINSELDTVVDEDKITESTIRALTARRLMLEKEGNFEKEWLSVCQTLHKWVELKLKRDDKVKEGSNNFVFDFSDLLNSVNDGEANDDDTKAATNAKSIKVKNKRGSSKSN